MSVIIYEVNAEKHSILLRDSPGSRWQKKKKLGLCDEKELHIAYWRIDI